MCVLDFTEENIFMTLVKDGKEDFLQGGSAAVGVLQ